MENGFILSEAAQYAFKCQDVYPDIISFAAAIPNHLKPIFLIPVKMERVAASERTMIASRIALDGSTPEGDLFSYQTFVNNDFEPNVTTTDPGSIFDIDGADAKTHHQEYNWDWNPQIPSDTSYMSDVDMSQYQPYPYRTPEKPVRKSSINEPQVLIIKLAIKYKDLEKKAPKKIVDNSEKCRVSLVSYLPKVRTFNFNVDAGNGTKDVKAALSDIDHVALSCNCKFWRYNGPEYHAKQNIYMLGVPFGRATKPNVRDPDGKYWLCKHAYAVIKRLETFIGGIKEDYPDDDKTELLETVTKKWGSLAEPTDVIVHDEDLTESGWYM